MISHNAILSHFPKWTHTNKSTIWGNIIFGTQMVAATNTRILVAAPYVSPQSFLLNQNGDTIIDDSIDDGVMTQIDGILKCKNNVACSTILDKSQLKHWKSVMTYLSGLSTLQPITLSQQNGMLTVTALSRDSFVRNKITLGTKMFSGNAIKGSWYADNIVKAISLCLTSLMPVTVIFTDGELPRLVFCNQDITMVLANVRGVDNENFNT